MGLGIPPIKIKIVLESNPLTSTILVGGLGVTHYPFLILVDIERLVRIMQTQQHANHVR